MTLKNMEPTLTAVEIKMFHREKLMCGPALF